MAPKKEEARRAVLSEYDSWAKKHPSQASMMGGFLFFRYLQAERSDLLDFRVGRQQLANRSRLDSRSVERLASVECLTRANRLSWFQGRWPHRQRRPNRVSALAADCHRVCDVASTTTSPRISTRKSPTTRWPRWRVYPPPISARIREKDPGRRPPTGVQHNRVRGSPGCRYCQISCPPKISGAPLSMDRGQLLLANTANLLAKPQRQND